MNVDQWLDTPSYEDKELYAKFVLSFCRLSIWTQIGFAKYIKPFKLFCTYNGDEYRVQGYSKVYGILLTTDLDASYGCDYKVPVNQCSNWSPTPLSLLIKE